jgi:predicted esterase
MKRLTCLTFEMLLACMLASCGAPTSMPPPTPISELVAGMINPGDEIDGMLFTTTDDIDWDISLAFLCDFSSWDDSSNRAAPCFTLPGSSVFFGNYSGVGYDTPEEAVEEWRKVGSEVTFDGQPLNLPAFGHIEFELDDMEWKYAQVWNLMVENITPGTHTIQTVWEDAEASENNTYVFTVSDKPETFPAVSAEAPHRLNPYTSEKAHLNYLLYLPGEYGVDPGRTWPLLIYLHGMDRVNTSVDVLRNDYPLNTLADQDDFPFVVLAPQGTGEHEFWATDEMVTSIMTLLDEVQSVLAVDANRIYLTGVSAGGNGTWSIGVRHPERFAAMVSVMGYYGWPPTVPGSICDLADIPVWAFHGAKDELIPLEAEQSLVDALRACGGDVQFTVFPDVGHEVDAQQIYTSELYTWLLSQTRK